jgi:diguanylate cyclase (GGDEF)-like protein
MRVLLIESEQEDIIFLQDVLVEIGEGRYGTNWVNLEILHAASWSQAAAILAKEPVDIILLDLDVLDSQGTETFRRAQLAAQGIPMILLLSGYEESLGVQLVREGAQDFLVKKQVDCAPLSHAMRNAIERQRLLNASRAASTHDALTGLLNRDGFLTCADRDRKIAERLNRRLMVMVAEPENPGEIATAYGEQRRDLILVEAADRLRSVASPADTIARIGTTRFGITIFDTEAEPLEAAWARIQVVLRKYDIHIGAAIFSSDQPATIDSLLEQARRVLSPHALAMRT